jgi:ADP-ribose pyrophosphatase
MSDCEGQRRSRARARYHQLRNERPDWFANHPGGFEIIVQDEEIDRAETEAFEVLQAAQIRGEIGAPVDREWVMVGVLAEDAWGVVLRDAVRTPQGDLRVYRREMTAPNRPAGIIALATFEDQLVLLKHYRHALRKFSWEIPRGFARPNETADATLKRQLFEEMQAVIANHRHSGLLEPDGGKLGDTIHLFSAAIKVLGEPERAEAIERLELVKVDELRRRVAENEITDALTLAAIAKLYCNGELPL